MLQDREQLKPADPASADSIADAAQAAQQLGLSGLMRDAGSGLLVTSMFGPSLNPNTGDWSVGCSGSWFEGGELAYPVTEITVAGNLIDIYGRLIPGSDLELRGATNAPSVLIPDLAIAGR